MELPFFSINPPRTVDRPAWPNDLIAFYSAHEGVGLDSGSERAVRICKLQEVDLIHWQDVRTVGRFEVPDGWRDFEAYRIGIGMFFEDIAYVLSAPCCDRGCILLIGGTAPGPGGDGPFIIENSLVLATCLQHWIDRLLANTGEEYAISGMSNLSADHQREVIGYYRSLNPNMATGVNAQ